MIKITYHFIWIFLLISCLPTPQPVIQPIDSTNGQSSNLPEPIYNPAPPQAPISPPVQQQTDYVAPIITLLGSTQITLNLGQSFIEPGFTANDNLDGNISSKVIVSGYVNSNLVGIYQLAYSVKDTQGNSSQTKYRIITIQNTSNTTGGTTTGGTTSGGTTSGGTTSGGSVIPASGNVFVPTDSTTPGHIVSFPAGFPAKDKYPLLIFLHGQGECGNGKNELSRLEIHGPAMKVKKKTWDTSLPFVLVSPQQPNKTDGSKCSGWSQSILENVYNYALKNYKVNPKQVYLTGLSLGGMGTLNHLNNTKLYSKFAAIIPIAARGNVKAENCSMVRQLGFWMFHGTKDTVITYNSGVSALNAYKNCNPIRSPKITSYEGVGHNSWTKTYDNNHGTTHIGGDGRSYSDIYKWLLSHQLR